MDRTASSAAGSSVRGKRSLVYAVFLPLLCLLRVGLGTGALYHQEAKQSHNPCPCFGGVTFLGTVSTSELYSA